MRHTGFAVFSFLVAAVGAPLAHGQATLVREFSAPTSTETLFGYRVAVDGDIIATVGQAEDERPVAYLFDMATGDLRHSLVAPGELTTSLYRNYYGAIAIENDKVVVGGIRLTSTTQDSPGSALIFDAVTGELVRTITAPVLPSGLGFGGSVAVSGGLAIIGSVDNRNSPDGRRLGPAFLYDISTGSLLRAFDAPSVDGLSVAIRGDAALVRGDSDDAVVQMFDVNSGESQRQFTAPDQDDQHLFGFSVAMSAGTALVSNHFEDGGAGAAYLFDLTTGEVIHRLAVSDGEDNDLFGVSVALDGDFALVGSMRDDNNTGSAYLFDATTGELLQKLTAPDGQPGDTFGRSVAISGDTIVVGTSGAGKAYQYTLAPRLGDFDGDGDVDADDVGLLFANLGDPAFDLTDDGLADAADVDALIGDILETFRGDADLDGAVGSADLAILAGGFDQPATSWADGDFTGDGWVGTPDLAVLAGFFGEGAAPVSGVATPLVPEPGVLACVGIGLVGTAMRRR